jgi:prophage antirepressor-like protein
MSNQIVPFDFNGSSVRVIEIDQAPWFVAKDICAILELENVTRACANLEADEKGSFTISKGTDGNPNVVVVSESGMYALVLKSRKPQAKAFRKWVTGTVLVEIRKTGKYEIPVIDPAPAPVRQLAPQRDLKDWIECMEIMNLTEDPILKSLVTQRMAEQLGGNTLPVSRQVLVSVRAGELGISQKFIGTGAQLGKYIVACGFRPSGKTPHGRYEVNCYDLTSELDRAILDFFGEGEGALVA